MNYKERFINTMVFKPVDQVVVLRRMYPGIRLVGRIDKMVLLEGRKAVDQELEKVIPLLEEVGFRPSPDHLIPPTVSFDQYRYFVDRRYEMVKRYHL